MCFTLPRSFSLGAEIRHSASLESAKAVPAGVQREHGACLLISPSREQSPSTGSLACAWARAEKSCMPCRSRGAGPEKLVPAPGAAAAEWRRWQGPGAGTGLGAALASVGAVPPSFPLGSGGLRRHPCLLKAFEIIPVCGGWGGLPNTGRAWEAQGEPHLGVGGAVGSR